MKQSTSIANPLDSVLLGFASTTPSRIRATPSTSKGKQIAEQFDGVVETPLADEDVRTPVNRVPYRVSRVKAISCAGAVQRTASPLGSIVPSDAPCIPTTFFPPGSRTFRTTASTFLPSLIFPLERDVMPEYNISLLWDADASVWVATSDDIPGLVLESGSLDALTERVRNAVPELLALNPNPALAFSSGLKPALCW